MKFSVSFVLAALALSSTASPIESVKGVKIPISKRTSLTKPDGTVDLEALQRSARASTNKILRGFEAYERNTGQPHNLAIGLKSSKRETGSVALTDHNGSLWYGSISVGTPAKEYTVDFDTGSSDLFLPGKSCTTNCEGHEIYDTSASSTAKDQGKTFSLQYGDGSTVSGEVYTDTVQVGGLTATSQAVGEAHTYSKGFASSGFPADGLMGMGFQQISNFGLDPVFQTLAAQGQTTESVFAFKLAKSGSELFLGGVDSSKHAGDFTYTPVTTEGYWEVDMDSISVGGKEAAPKFSAIIDTGTSLVIGPSDQVKKFYESVPGSKDASSTVGQGFYTFPCNDVPDVSVRFGGNSFPISAKTFNLGAKSEGSADCVGGISGSSSENFWIIGDVFLQNVYTAFDYGNTRVGFANLA